MSTAPLTFATAVHTKNGGTIRAQGLTRSSSAPYYHPGVRRAKQQVRAALDTQDEVAKLRRLTQALDVGLDIRKDLRSVPDLRRAEADKHDLTSLIAHRRKVALEKAAAAAAAEAAKAAEEEESDAEDDMDDEEFERQLEKLAAKPRSSAISSERTEVNPNFVAPEHEKTDEQRARLTAALLKSFMFAALQSEELDKVIKAFVAFPAETGVVIIEQGAQVNSTEPALFVLEEGELDVYKKGVEAPVFTYNKTGQSFGELALLYNAPRAATVKTKSASMLWAIDRDTFNCLVKDAARQAKERRVQFLKDVPLLASLQAEDVSKLADALEVINVEAGKVVIAEGDVGSDFYIVELGNLEAKKDKQVVMSYKTKDFFGELALLRDAPRAATIETTVACRLLKLDRSGFSRILGKTLNADMEKHAAELYATAGIQK